MWQDPLQQESARAAELRRIHLAQVMLGGAGLGDALMGILVRAFLTSAFLAAAPALRSPGALVSFLSAQALAVLVWKLAGKALSHARETSVFWIAVVLGACTEVLVEWVLWPRL